MRPPPPLSRLPFFPVTGGIALIAIVVTAVRLMHHADGVQSQSPTAALEMSYLAFHGQPWRLITCIFPHVNPIHLFFDVYWFWALGSVLEARFGHLKIAAFYVLLAVGSSIPEYAFAIGGVGLSGVVYGLFAFLWVLGKSERDLQDVIDLKTAQFFVGWFFLCIVLTMANIMAVANYAHGAGAILGALIGWAMQRGTENHPSPARIPAMVGIIIFLSASFWAATVGRPLVNFSHRGDSDLLNLGYEALNRDDNESALKYLKIATSMRYPSPSSWLDLGIAYEKLGHERQANAAFRKAQELGAIDGAGNPVKVGKPGDD